MSDQVSGPSIEDVLGDSYNRVFNARVSLEVILREVTRREDDLDESELQAIQGTGKEGLGGNEGQEREA